VTNFIHKNTLKYEYYILFYIKKLYTDRLIIVEKKGCPKKTKYVLYRVFSNTNPKFYKHMGLLVSCLVCLKLIRFYCRDLTHALNLNNRVTRQPFNCGNI